MKKTLFIIMFCFLNFGLLKSQGIQKIIDKQFVVYSDSFVGLSGEREDTKTEFIVTKFSLLQLFHPMGTDYIYVYDIISKNIKGQEYHIETRIGKSGKSEVWIFSDRYIKRTWKDSKDVVTYNVRFYSSLDD